MTLEGLANEFATKLSLNDDKATNAKTKGILTTKTSSPKRAPIWESDVWRACQNGRSFELQSYLAKLNPQDVSRFVNARDRNGNTALIVASAAAHRDVTYAAVIPILLEAGADINTKNQEGRTALMEASLLGGFGAVKALLKPKRGEPADTNLSDNSGLRAVELAGSDQSLILERRKRCADGENTENTFDEEAQGRIVRLLRKFCTEDNASTSSGDRFKSQSTGNGKDVSEGGASTSSNDIHHHRVDSHEQDADGITFLKRQLAQSYKQRRKVQSDLQEAKQKIDTLQGEVECYKTRWSKSVSKRLEGITKEAALQVELESCEQELIRRKAQQFQLEQQDRPHEMKLDGRASTIPDDIRFKRTYCDNELTEVVLSRKFTFTMKTWRGNDGLDYEGHDGAAVGCLKFCGRLYIAKAGRWRGDFGEFIFSDHWSSKANFLAQVVGFNFKKGFAIHTEPQLIAFYVTRTLQKSGYGLSKFGKKSTLPVRNDRTELETIVIHVSRQICKSCREFTSKVNGVAASYGYCFELRDAGESDTQDEDESEY